MIELGPKNCQYIRATSNHPRITFTKSGSVYFNKPAMKMLKLQTTSEVIFILDGDLILVAKHNGGFPLSSFKSTQAGFSNLELRRRIADFVSIDDRTFRLHIKPETIKKKGYELGCFELDKNYK